MNKRAQISNEHCIAADSQRHDSSIFQHFWNGTINEEIGRHKTIQTKTYTTHTHAENGECKKKIRKNEWRRREEKKEKCRRIDVSWSEMHGESELERRRRNGEKKPQQAASEHCVCVCACALLLFCIVLSWEMRVFCMTVAAFAGKNEMERKNEFSSVSWESHEKKNESELVGQTLCTHFDKSLACRMHIGHIGDGVGRQFAEKGTARSMFSCH